MAWRFLAEVASQQVGQACLQSTAVVDEQIAPNFTPEAVLDVDGFRLAGSDNALVLGADAARADNVVVVQAGQTGFQPFIAQFLDINLNGLVSAVGELLGEVVAVLDSDLDVGMVFDGCHDGDAL